MEMERDNKVLLSFDDKSNELLPLLVSDLKVCTCEENFNTSNFVFVTNIQQKRNFESGLNLKTNTMCRVLNKNT